MKPYKLHYSGEEDAKIRKTLSRRIFSPQITQAQICYTPRDHLKVLDTMFM